MNEWESKKKNWNSIDRSRFTFFFTNEIQEYWIITKRELSIQMVLDCSLSQNFKRHATDQTRTVQGICSPPAVFCKLKRQISERTFGSRYLQRITHEKGKEKGRIFFSRVTTQYP